ncbi:MAG: hypothetical protein AAF718_02715 [Pseudomonadota bacterium]
MSGMGHNGGPTMEKGRGWRRYAWKRARAELLPKMPIEVVRRRVKRARELGLDYKAYAGIRAATGRDVIALLFSDNALRLMADARMPSDRAAHLAALRHVEALALVHAPLDPDRVLEAHPLFTRAGTAPGFMANWGEVRDKVLEVKGVLPADGVVVIGETWLERDWCAAARLAGYLSAERYFAPR